MESSVVKKTGKKEKTPIQEFEGQVKDIRQQFIEQIKCLENRTDNQTSLLLELQDFYKRRADIELDYSRNLDKLAKQILARHKAEKQKRDAWSVFSLYGHWQQLVEETKSEARNRAATADLYVNHVTAKLTNEAEELQRISKRCREIAFAAQQEILRVLGELHTAMKTYQLCHAASCTAETKFRAVEAQKCRFEETNPKKIGGRKHRFLEKEFEKKQSKYVEFKLKALKARNEYLLCIDAANAALHKYFADDLSDLLDCLDIGSEQWLKFLVTTINDARRTVLENEAKNLDNNREWVRELDNRTDKRRFLEANHSTFMLPRKFEFRAHAADDVSHVTAQKAVQEDLVQRYWQLNQRLMQLKTETEEIWKTLETAEKTLMDIQKMPEVKLPELYAPTETPRRNSCREPETAQQKRKQDLCEMEDYYLQKFHQYLLTGNLIRRLEARHDAIQSALGIPASSMPSSFHQNGHDSQSESISRDSSTQLLAGECTPSPNPDSLNGGSHSILQGLLSNRPPSVSVKPRKKRIGASAVAEQRPKLFGGSIEEYVEATGQEIPLIIRSCIRMLSLHGLHHQGVFRVSGSQIEINSYKDSFERGEDPLTDVADASASDVNSVAGVLKLYFRELREPLFPIFMFDQFVECSRIENKDDFPSKVSDLIRTLPRPVFVTMRYLFAFLNHLSEFSDENMMDPYNLAICFGPTLLPIPESRDQVFFHNHVNDLMKNLIIYHEEIFPNDTGIVYEKYLLADNADNGNEEDDEVVVGTEEEDAMLTSISDPPMMICSEEDIMTRSVYEHDRRRMLYERSISCGSHSDLDLSSHVSLKAPDSPGNALDDVVWQKREHSSSAKPASITAETVRKSDPLPGCSVSKIDNDIKQSMFKMETNLSRINKLLPKEDEDSGKCSDLSPPSSASNSPRDLKNTASATTSVPLSIDTKLYHNTSYSAKNLSSSSFSAAAIAGGGSAKSPLSTSRLHSTESWSLKPYQRREGAIASLKRLSLNSYGTAAAAAAATTTTATTTGGNTIPNTNMVASANPNPVTRTVSDDSSQNLQTSDVAEILTKPRYSPSAHQPPKGLSPTSLKEIQVELKAVLNSLESFTIQQSRLNSGGGESQSMGGKFAKFTTGGSLSAVSPPDLVQNLPLSLAGISTVDTMRSASLTAVPPPPVTPPYDRTAIPPHHMSAVDTSLAEQFAENKENTLKKNAYFTSSLDGVTPIAESAAERYSVVSHKTAKPPVPRKPSSGSPQLSRRTTPVGQIECPNSAKF